MGNHSLLSNAHVACVNVDVQVKKTREFVSFRECTSVKSKGCRTCDAAKHMSGANRTSLIRARAEVCWDV